MRIIHDVRVPMTCVVGGRPYVNTRGTQGFNGLILEIMACEDHPANHSDLPAQMFGDEEPIYIEGTGKYIVTMLERMLEAAKNIVEISAERMGPQRPTDCPDCDPGIRYHNATHTEECPLG